jgi:hypothetical protein
MDENIVKQLGVAAEPREVAVLPGYDIFSGSRWLPTPPSAFNDLEVQKGNDGL